MPPTCQQLPKAVGIEGVVDRLGFATALGESFRGVLGACRRRPYGLSKTPLAPGTLATLFVLYSGASAVCATVDVQGDAASVQVVDRQAPLSEVLVALSRKVEIRYDAMVNVDGVVDGTYRGTLGDVLARVLNGYNYVVSTREGSTEIIIVERVGSPPAAITPTQTPSLPENTNPAAQWRLKLQATQKP